MNLDIHPRLLFFFSLSGNNFRVSRQKISNPGTKTPSAQVATDPARMLCHASLDLSEQAHSHWMTWRSDFARLAHDLEEARW